MQSFVRGQNHTENDHMLNSTSNPTLVRVQRVTVLSAMRTCLQTGATAPLPAITRRPFAYSERHDFVCGRGGAVASGSGKRLVGGMRRHRFGRCIRGRYGIAPGAPIEVWLRSHESSGTGPRAVVSQPSLAPLPVFGRPRSPVSLRDRHARASLRIDR